MEEGSGCMLEREGGRACGHQAGFLACARGKPGSLTVDQLLSRTVGGSLLQFALRGQPSAGAAQALGSYRCTLASPAARRAGGHCGICGDREPQV